MVLVKSTEHRVLSYRRRVSSKSWGHPFGLRVALTPRLRRGGTQRSKAEPLHFVHPVMPGFMIPSHSALGHCTASSSAPRCSRLEACFSQSSRLSPSSTSHRPQKIRRSHAGRLLASTVAGVIISPGCCRAFQLSSSDFSVDRAPEVVEADGSLLRGSSTRSPALLTLGAEPLFPLRLELLPLP